MSGMLLGHRWRWKLFRLLLLVSLSLQIIPGVSADPKNGTKGGTHSESTSTTSGSLVIILLVVLVTVVLFSFFLYKLWQKKKRQEQYARLLKLFEEDDELELELGLRD